MKKYKILLLLVVLIIPHLILSQNSSKVEFEGGEIYLIAKDAETDKQIFKKPIGRVINIEYDSFYKSYQIFYNYKNEGATFLKFEHLEDTEMFEHLEDTEGMEMRIFIETVSKKKYGVVDFYIFEDDYWPYKDNMKGFLYFLPFEVLVNKNGGSKIMGVISIENFKRK